MNAPLGVTPQSPADTCCHPSAPWLCALCGAGVAYAITILGGVRTCGSCYSRWALRVEEGKRQALADVARVGLQAMLIVPPFAPVCERRTLRVNWTSLQVHKVDPATMGVSEAQP